MVPIPVLHVLFGVGEVVWKRWSHKESQRCVKEKDGREGRAVE